MTLEKYVRIKRIIVDLRNERRVLIHDVFVQEPSRIALYGKSGMELNKRSYERIRESTAKGLLYCSVKDWETYYAKKE